MCVCVYMWESVLCFDWLVMLTRRGAQFGSLTFTAVFFSCKMFLCVLVMRLVLFYSTSTLFCPHHRQPLFSVPCRGRFVFGLTFSWDWSWCSCCTVKMDIPSISIAWAGRCDRMRGRLAVVSEIYQSTTRSDILFLYFLPFYTVSYFSCVSLSYNDARVKTLH